MPFKNLLGPPIQINTWVLIELNFENVDSYHPRSTRVLLEILIFLGDHPTITVDT